MYTCKLCPRQCNVDKEKQAGFCGTNQNLKIAKVMVHHWEEPIISDTNGSGAIFFSHCNLKCVYCQNYKISTLGNGKETTVDNLVSLFKQLEAKKVHNINLVSPTQYSKEIISAIKIYKPHIPIVWNSNGYESVETLKKLKGLVDIYLVDFKYYDNKLALKYSSAPNYFEICCNAIKEMHNQQPQNIFYKGILKKGIIIRHLVLPNHSLDSINIIDWLSKNFDKNLIISLMWQYIPCNLQNLDKDLSRKVKPIEYKRVLEFLKKQNFKLGFEQSDESSSASFIPDFDYSGEFIY